MVAHEQLRTPTISFIWFYHRGAAASWICCPYIDKVMHQSMLTSTHAQTDAGVFVHLLTSCWQCRDKVSIRSVPEVVKIIGGPIPWTIDSNHYFPLFPSTTHELLCTGCITHVFLIRNGGDLSCSTERAACYLLLALQLLVNCENHANVSLPALLKNVKRKKLKLKDLLAVWSYVLCGRNVLSGVGSLHHEVQLPKDDMPRQHPGPNCNGPW